MGKTKSKQVDEREDLESFLRAHMCIGVVKDKPYTQKETNEGIELMEEEIANR